MKRRKTERRKRKGRIGSPGHRRPRVPPPESDIWPEQYRGERWKPIYAILFAGKCAVVHALLPPAEVATTGGQVAAPDPAPALHAPPVQSRRDSGRSC